MVRTDIHLVIAGRATESKLKKAQKLVKRAGIENSVKFVVNCDEDVKAQLLRRALFLCMPSRVEGWGIVAVESAAAGKLCIGSDIDGLREAIQDGTTGYLIRPDDPIALANKMLWLLAHPEVRKKQVEKCRQWAKRFDWETIALEQESFYKEVIKVPNMDHHGEDLKN